MMRYAIRHLLGGVLTLLGATLVVFLLMQQVPGSPWSRRGDAMSNIPDDSARRRTLNQRFGLDQPLWRQIMRYFVGDVDPQGRFVCGLICLNLGPSQVQAGRTNQDILFSPPPGAGSFSSRFGYSLRLVLLALLFAAGLGLPLGIASAAKRGTAIDHAISLFATTLLSVPAFILGLLLLLVVAGWLHWIDFVVDWTEPRDWIMPALIVSLPLLGATARLTRSSMLDVLHGDYVRTARGKGLHEGAVFGVHVFRNALAPVLTYMGPAAVELFATSVVVEYMFAFPGMGRVFIDALKYLDYPLILSITAVYAGMIVLVSLLVNVLRGMVDPRLRAA